ncbi:MAG: hypothetical protein WBG76_01110 [Ornithinimicrobium sp.]
MPKQGPSVRAALRGSFPGLLVALNDAQLDQWQDFVDYRARREVHDQYRDALVARHGVDAGGGRKIVIASDMRDEQDRLERDRPATRLAGTLTIKASDMLAPAVQRPPDQDVTAEMGFRQWAAEQLAGRAVELDLKPTLPSALSDRLLIFKYSSNPLPIVHNHKGVITVEDLQAEFAEEYKTHVTERPQLAELLAEIEELENAQRAARAQHSTLSEANEDQPVVRHIGELLGRGGYDYPSIRGWDMPIMATERAKQLVKERRLVIAMPVLARAVDGTNDIAERFANYYGEVMSGVSRTVTVLEGAKWLGSIAAGIASGGLGLTASALITGGYAATQNLAQQASGVAFGTHNRVNVQSAVDDAGIAIVMSLVGGKIQGRFEQVIHLRIDAMQGLSAGGKQFLANMIAATAASPITTSTNAVLDAIIKGTALPSSPEDFADMIVEGAVRDSLVNLGTYGVSARVASEFAAWRAGRSAPIQIPGAEPVVPADAEGPASSLHDTSIRSMLERRGGWREIHADLTQGQGLGAGLSAAERRAVLHRFEAHRRAMAEEIADDFGGRVERSATDEIRVVFEGDDAALRQSQAEELLGLRDPAWRAAGMSLEVRPATDGGTEQAIAARMDSDVRHMSNQFVEVYQMWGEMGPEGRARFLVAVANGALERGGYPPIGVELTATDLSGNASGQMDSRSWKIVVHRRYLKDAATPAEFAEVASLFAHEARHAMQWLRAARVSGDDKAMAALRPDVREYVRKSQDMEPLLPGSAAHDDAVSFHRSVFGDGAAERKKVYDELYLAVEGVRVFTENLHAVEGDASSSPRDVQRARLGIAEAREQLRKADRAYRRLPEEVDAHAYGAATGQALSKALVRKRDGLIRSYRKANAVVERRIQTFEDWAELARAPGGERATQRLARARDEMLASMRRLTRVEDRLAAFEIKVRR